MNKRTKKGIVIALSAVCIAGLAGGTYLYVNGRYDNEVQAVEEDVKDLTYAEVSDDTLNNIIGLCYTDVDDMVYTDTQAVGKDSEKADGEDGETAGTNSKADKKDNDKSNTMVATDSSKDSSNTTAAADGVKDSSNTTAAQSATQTTTSTESSTTSATTSTGSSTTAATTESAKQSSSGSNAGKTWHDPVYETVWVVDEEAYTEEIPVYEQRERTICYGCGAVVTRDDLYNHFCSASSLPECGGYYSEWYNVQVGTQTLYHEEVGHYETQIIQEGYWE